jgi:hypothetical protein
LALVSSRTELCCESTDCKSFIAWKRVRSLQEILIQKHRAGVKADCKQRLICYHRLIGVKLPRGISSTARAAGRNILWLAFLSAASFAQSPSVSSYRDPVDLVRKAVQNEVKATADDYFMFRGVKTTSKGSTTKLYVETKEATAGLVIAYDGKPLTQDQRQGEQDRLERFVKNPEELRKKRAQEHDDADRTTRIVRALPDAFLFEYAGEEPGSTGIGKPGEPLVKLKFRPNPDYHPPSHVEEVLTGMQGHILVDAHRFRVASIDGTLFKPVGFGWGILGHLDRGGHFIVHQQEVEDNCWEISSMTVNFTGKILLFKNLFIESTEVFTGFKRVSSDLSFAQAIDLLKKEESALAGNHASAALAQKR